MHSRRPRAGAVLGAWMALAGCSMDYEEAMVQQSMAESIPDVVLMNFQHFIVRRGRVVASITAERAEQYEKRQQTILEVVYLREYGDDGEVISEAWADRAVYHSESENAEASGSIYLYSHREEAEVFAETLTWDEEGRRLRSEPDEVVRLRREDASELVGRGFEADFRHNVLRFSGGAEGIYTYEEEE